MKKIIIVILLLFMVVSLSSCHHGSVFEAFTIPENFDDTKEYTISFWAKNDNNFYQKKIYEDAIVEFNKYYPNIHVNMVSYTNYNDIYADVLKNMKTKTTPNVCVSYIDYVATFLEGENIIVPLDSFLTDSKYGLGGEKIKFDSVKKNDIYEKFLDEGLYNGSYYTLPFMRSTEALYINEDYVKWLGYDEIPQYVTWDYVVEVSRAALAKRKEGLSPYKSLTTDEEITADLNQFFPIIYKSVDNQMITMLKQLGLPYSNERGENFLFSDETANLVKEYANYKNEGLYNIFNIVSYPGNHFNIGNCIFAIDSTAGATWMGSDAPLTDIHDNSRVVEFNTVVRPVMQYDTTNPKMISQGPSLCLFNKSDEGEVMASWIFANFLLTDYVQIRYSQTEGYIPVTKTATTNPSYQKYLNSNENTDPSEFDGLISSADIYSSDVSNFLYSVKIEAAKMAIANIKNTFITPAFNGSTSLRNAAGYLIEYGMKTSRNVDKEDYISKLYSRTIDMYKLKPYEADDSLSRNGLTFIIFLAVTWSILGIISIRTIIKKRKKE